MKRDRGKLDTPSRPSTSNHTNSIHLDKTWSKDDDLHLISALLAALPQDDSKRYFTRLKLIDWKSIAFSNYSAEECRSRWLLIQLHQRRYRVLGDILHDAKSWTEQRRCNVNELSKKHLKYPKRPLSALQLFIKAKESEILKKKPGLNRVELKKLATKLFRGLSEHKKQKYENLANAEKEKYKTKVKKLKEDHPEIVSEEEELHALRATNQEVNATLGVPVLTKKEQLLMGKFLGKPHMPPKTGYKLFLKEIAKNVTPSTEKKTAHLRQWWKGLSKQQKQSYEERCSEMNRVYRLELTDYLNTWTPQRKLELLDSLASGSKWHGLPIPLDQSVKKVKIGGAMKNGTNGTLSLNGFVSQNSSNTLEIPLAPAGNKLLRPNPTASASVERTDSSVAPEVTSTKKRKRQRGT